MSPSSPRGLVESDEWDAQRDALGLDPKDLDEALLGLTWAIASDPDQFPEVAWGIRIAVTRPHHPDVPALLVVFRVDNFNWECELLWLEPA